MTIQNGNVWQAGFETRETTQVRARNGVRTVEKARRQLKRTLRWNDLRHISASRLRMSGVELGTIRDLLGHTSTRMTERYAHVTPARTGRFLTWL